jgi:hypothetical protein
VLSNQVEGEGRAGLLRLGQDVDVDGEAGLRLRTDIKLEIWNLRVRPCGEGGGGDGCDGDGGPGAW